MPRPGGVASPIEETRAKVEAESLQTLDDTVALCRQLGHHLNEFLCQLLYQFCLCDVLATLVEIAQKLRYV